MVKADLIKRAIEATNLESPDARESVDALRGLLHSRSNSLPSRGDAPGSLRPGGQVVAGDLQEEASNGEPEPESCEQVRVSVNPLRRSSPVE